MKHLIRLSLLLLAIAGLLLFSPVGFVYACFVALFRLSPDAGTDYLSNLILTLAEGVDRLGNVITGPLCNALLITPDGYLFGNGRETLSRVLGKNKQRGTLTKAGRWLCVQLDRVQANHVEMAASDDNQ